MTEDSSSIRDIISKRTSFEEFASEMLFSQQVLEQLFGQSKCKYVIQ